MAICYFDQYRRVEENAAPTWLFERRVERHWYAADTTERPQEVGFDSWHTAGGPPQLPDAFETWAPFWAGHEAPGRQG